LWSTNENTASVIVSPTSSTNYTVTYTISGCPSAIASGSVTVSPSPIVNLGADTTICTVDFPYTLTASVAGTNNQFSWNTGDQTQSITITMGGTYTVNVTNSSGCSASDVIQIISDPCASLNEGLTSAIMLKPNPTQDISTLSTAGLTITKVSICNAEGQLVKEIDEIGGDVFIDLSAFSRGVYFVNVMYKEGTLVRKLVKQ
jgi:hypothetical protein